MLRLKSIVIVAGLVLLAVGVFVLENDYKGSAIPNVPVYPGAREIQTKVNENSSRSPDDPIVLIRFETSDQFAKVEAFYADLLHRDGWQYDRCCKLYRHTRGDPRYFGPYLAYVTIKDSGNGQTAVTIEINQGTIICDCFTSEGEVIRRIG